MPHLRKNGYYYCTYRDRNAQRKYKSLNTTDRKKAVKLEKRFKENLGGITVSELRDRFRKFLINKSESHQKSVKDCSWDFMKFVGDKPLKLIDVQHIIDYQDSLTGRGFKKNSVSHYLRVLQAMFNWGYKYDLIDRDIFKTIKIEKTQPKVEWLPVQEIQCLLSVIEDGLHLCFMELCLLTGARRSEIANLEWENVDENHLHIWETKIGEPHHFPMNLKLAQVLNWIWKLQNKGDELFNFERISNTDSEAFSDEFFKEVFAKETSENTKIIGNVNEDRKTGYVLSNLNGEKLSGDWLSKMVKKYFRRAGLKKTYSLHTLRHSFACNLLIKNVSIYTVSKLLNHKSVRTTEDFYSHVSSDYMKVDTDFYSN